MSPALHITLLTLLVSTAASSQTIETDTLQSTHTGDRYLITIRKPAGYTQKNKYHFVYMADGGIRMGDYVLGRKKSWAATVPSNCVIIAIGHIGNYNDLRPRDFIPSDITKNEEKNFGKADRFYLFMKNELIPRTEKKMTNTEICPNCHLEGHMPNARYCYNCGHELNPK